MALKKERDDFSTPMLFKQMCMLKHCLESDRSNIDGIDVMQIGSLDSFYYDKYVIFTQFKF